MWSNSAPQIGIQISVHDLGLHSDAAMANLNLSNGKFPAKLPFLDEKNYEQWVVQMKVVFHFQDVF